MKNAITLIVAAAIALSGSAFAQDKMDKKMDKAPMAKGHMMKGHMAKGHMTGHMMKGHKVKGHMMGMGAPKMVKGHPKMPKMMKGGMMKKDDMKKGG